MWKEAGFSESCAFSQLFVNVQGFHLSCLRASFSAGPKYNYYFFANGFLNSSTVHLQTATKKRRQKAVLSWSLYSLRAQQHVSRKEEMGRLSAVCVWIGHAAHNWETSRGWSHEGGVDSLFHPLDKARETALPCRHIYYFSKEKWMKPRQCLWNI